MNDKFDALEGQAILETICYQCRDYGFCQGDKMEMCPDVRRDMNETEKLAEELAKEIYEDFATPYKWETLDNDYKLFWRQKIISKFLPVLKSAGMAFPQELTSQGWLSPEQVKKLKPKTAHLTVYLTRKQITELLFCVNEMEGNDLKSNERRVLFRAKNNLMNAVAEQKTETKES